MENKIIDSDDVIELARQFEVDQYDILETFVCDLLDISPDRLYEILEGEYDEKI